MYVFVIYSGTPLIRPPLGQKKIGRINGVAVLTTVFLQENVCRFLPGSQNHYMLYISRLSLQQQQKNSWSE